MSTSPSVPLLLAAPFPPFLAVPLGQTYLCHDYFHAQDKAAFLASHGQSIRGLAMAGGTVLSEELLGGLPALEIISVFGVGYDGVPLPYCRYRGLRVTNTPDVLTEDVADIAVALVLMTSRKLAAANRFLHEGQWSGGQFELAWKLGGKRAGIFGLGRIGKAIATRLAAHGMEIGYHGRSAQKEVSYPYFASLESLAEWSDFLVAACPGGPETRHAVNASVLKALGAKGTLINVSRGSVVEQETLVTFLSEGGIRSAGLDVFENEPQVPAALSAMSNVVLLPHVGSGTHETRQAMADLVIQNLAAHFSGQPLLTPVL